MCRESPTIPVSSRIKRVFEDLLPTDPVRTKRRKEMRTARTPMKSFTVVGSNSTDFEPGSPANNQAGNPTAIRRLAGASVFLMVLAATTLAQSTFVYVDNDVATVNTVSGFSVGPGGALSPIAGSPFSTGGAGNSGIGNLAATREAISTAGRFLYVGNSGSSNISGFSINPATGFLTPVPGSPFAAGGNSQFPGYSLAVAPNNKFLFCAHDTDISISAFSISGNGSLTPVPGSPFFPGLAHTDGIRVSPDGRFLAVADGMAPSVAVFTIGSTGALTPAPGSPFSVFPGALTGIDINCAGNLLFATQAGPGSAAVNVLTIAASGALTPIAGSPFVFSGSGSNVPFLSPNGKLLFVSNQLGGGGIGSFTVLNVAANGSLSEVPGSPFPNPGGFGPSIIETDSTGRFLFAGNDFHSVSVFSIGSGGTLTPAPGSPFGTGINSGLGSLAVFPGKACPTFDTCMRDDTTGNVFSFSSTTGAYQFTRCSDGFSISGTGTIRMIGSVLILTDNKPDRRISASFLNGQLTGNATIMLMVAQGVWQTFTVHDTTSLGTGCSCSG
jgi:6-phosphogluconolactonase (cycloisomerase 2 family)